MAIAKQGDVSRILSPERELKLERAFKQAYDDVQQDLGRYSIWPRTRANMMFERLAVRLQEVFFDDSGASFVFHDETIKIVFDNKIVARCKKADDLGFGHNIPTQANFAFLDPQYELPGMEGLQKIEIVYGLNRLETEIDAIVVQARDGERRIWGYPIPRSATGSGAPPLPLPHAMPPRPAPSREADDLVKPRKTPVRKKETDESEK